MPEEINNQNVFEIDIPKLALDDRFGSLKFEEAGDKLPKAQTWLKEVYDLDYKKLLLDTDAQKVEKLTTDLVSLLTWLKQFDIGNVSNPKGEKDGYNNRVNHFYTDVYRQVLMELLPFLREQRRRENPDQEKLDEEVAKVTKIRAELETELKKVKEESEKIRTTKKEVGSEKGKRAAVRMAGYFSEEVYYYNKLAKKWFWAVIIGYVLVLGALVELGVVAFGNPNQIIWTELVTRLVILAALWYGLYFIIRNYNINSHLGAVNRHRTAVASTLEDFISAEQEQENPKLSEILQNATDAMFKNVPIGYVSKTEKEAGNPVLQIINDLMGANKN